MKKTTFLIFGLASSLALTGCELLPTASDNAQPMAAQEESRPIIVELPKAATKKPELLKISGIGYGAESSYAAYTPGQRRLMAIRASKLDAYRALAEQLYGIKIDSNTSVATLTAKNDSFRARVNAVVRGARIVSITPMADHNYETVLEVYVDKKFFEEAFIYSGSDTSKAMEPDAVYKVSSY
jgi:hypothetical protein